jgi:hypothetical protein
MVPLVYQMWGVGEAVIIGCAFALLLGIIVRWRQRFRNEVDTNFRVLHQLQLGLSLGMLGYMGFHLFSR